MVARLEIGGGGRRGDCFILIPPICPAPTSTLLQNQNVVRNVGPFQKALERRILRLRYCPAFAILARNIPTVPGSQENRHDL